MKTLGFTTKCSRSTHHALWHFLAQQRDLWNNALEKRITAHQQQAATLSVHDQCKDLTALRAGDSNHSQYPVAAQRSILFRLDKAFRAFFARLEAGAGKKLGFPRFKGDNRRVRSFDVPEPNLKARGKYRILHVKGVGKFRFGTRGRKLAKVKAARVVLTPCRVQVQVIVETPPPSQDQDTRSALGSDLGIKQQFTLSNGVQFPKCWRRLQEAKRRQR